MTLAYFELKLCLTPVRNLLIQGYLPLTKSCRFQRKNTFKGNGIISSLYTPDLFDTKVLLQTCICDILHRADC